MTPPLVSVIIPVRNGEKHLAATLRSVLDQTYPSVEIIVVDDASEDGTLKVVESLGTGKRIRSVRNAVNIGAAASRNRGFQMATGKMIKFLDGDDLIDPATIAGQVALSLLEPDCVISGKHGRFYNDDIHTFCPVPEDCWRTLPSADWLCSSWANARSMTNPGIFLIPRTVIEKAGPWNEELSLLDDLEYFARTISCSQKVIFCEHANLYYRSGDPNSLSATRTLVGYESAYRALALGSGALLKLEDGQAIRQACANTWRSFSYDLYPEYPDLLQKVEENLRALPKPTIPFPGGNLARLLSKLIGWKLTKKLRIKWQHLGK